MAKGVGKARGWACVIYPESAPRGWLSVLEDGHVPTYVSPLHDRDVTADGQPKKPHWHVLAVWEGPVSDRVAAMYFARAGVTAPPERVASIRGYARYLVHMDDHHKYRSDDSGIIVISGGDGGRWAWDEGEVVGRALDDIEDWIDATGCISYAALCRYARRERPDWTPVIRTHTIHLTALLRSYEWEASIDKASR